MQKKRSLSWEREQLLKRTDTQVLRCLKARRTRKPEELGRLGRANFKNRTVFKFSGLYSELGLTKTFGGCRRWQLTFIDDSPYAKTFARIRDAWQHRRRLSLFCRQGNWRTNPHLVWGRVQVHEAKQCVSLACAESHLLLASESPFGVFQLQKGECLASVGKLMGWWWVHGSRFILNTYVVELFPKRSHRVGLKYLLDCSGSEKVRPEPTRRHQLYVEWSER